MGLYVERPGPLAASDVYKCTSRAQIKRWWVAFSPLGEFCRALKKLKRGLDAHTRDDYWAPFFWRLDRYQFLLSTLPLPSNHPSIYPAGTIEVLEERLRQCHLLYPEHAQTAKDLLIRLSTLVSEGLNPLFNELLQLGDKSERASVALVVKEPHFIRDVESLLASEEVLRNVVVVGAQHLRENYCYDQLIILGAPRWYPEHVYTAPRGREIHVVCYDWVRDNWKPERAFIGSSSSSRSSIFSRGQLDKHALSSPSSDHLSAEELLPEIDLDQLHKRFSRHSTGDLELEAVQARLLLLEGGSAVFIEASENSKVMVIDLDEDEEGGTERRTSSLPRVTVSDIEPGMYVLLRTGGGGDYLIPLADKFLGKNAQKLREGQEHWKGLLIEKARERGLLETSVALLDLGSMRAEENNLRNWMSSRNIRPHDKEDFAAIMKLIGLAEQTDEYWRNAGIIRSAHIRAGFRIRKLLLTQAANADFSELERTGRMDFELPGANAGSITAFRVIAVSQNLYTVPVSQVGDPFESDDALWRE